MASKIFRKFHGMTDKQLMGAVGNQAMLQHMQTQVINHNARLLLWVIALALTEAAVVGYIAFTLFWR